MPSQAQRALQDCSSSHAGGDCSYHVRSLLHAKPQSPYRSINIEAAHGCSVLWAMQQPAFKAGCCMCVLRSACSAAAGLQKVTVPHSMLPVRVPRRWGLQCTVAGVLCAVVRLAVPSGVWLATGSDLCAAHSSSHGACQSHASVQGCQLQDACMHKVGRA